MRHSAFRMMAALAAVCIVLHWSANRFYWNSVDYSVIVSREGMVSASESAVSAVGGVQQPLSRTQPDSATNAVPAYALWKVTRSLPATRRQTGLEVINGSGVDVTIHTALTASVPTIARGQEVLIPGVSFSNPALETLQPPAKVAASDSGVNNSLRKTTLSAQRRKPWPLPMTTSPPLPTLNPLGRFVTGYFGVGRLGNNMFVYASTFGVALRHGLRVAYCLDDVQLAWYAWMRTAFQLSAPAGSCKFNPDTYIMEIGWGVYTPAVDSPSNFLQRTFLLTYLQSYKYFEAYRPQLLREFALTPAYAQHADGVLRRAAAGRLNVTFVGVHVRRGDMVGHRLYNVAPESYLARAVEAFRARHRGSAASLVFIVASDDAKWTAEALRRTGLSNDATLVSTNAEIDLAVLSRCNHTIITSGTFGWWAAWLAGGDVIYYRGFMPNTSELASGYNPADYYPPAWLGLD